MWVKLHKSSRTVVAICDDNLIGKRFEEGIKQLDIRESFYRGENLSKKDTINLMKLEFKQGSTFNIIGKDSINCALEAGIIDEDSTLKVKDIPFIIIVN